MNYILFDCHDSVISADSLQQLHQYEEIHVRCDSKMEKIHFNNIISTLSKLNKTCYVYVFNVWQHDIVIQYGLTSHLCFINDNILSSDLMQCIDENKENFWIIDNTVLSRDISIYIEKLQMLNIPICIVISPLLHPDGLFDHEQLRLFVKDIHHGFNNPLYEKEINLQVSSYTQHYYLQQKKQKCFLHHLVMGMFGDVIVYEENIANINIKKIMKTVDCMNCQLQEKCLERGIGYIMHTLQLKGCVSYQLMKYNKTTHGV